MDIVKKCEWILLKNVDRYCFKNVDGHCLKSGWILLKTWMDIVLKMCMDIV